MLEEWCHGSKKKPIGMIMDKITHCKLQAPVKAENRMLIQKLAMCTQINFL